MALSTSPSSQAVNPRPDRRVTWEWNTKLLTIAVVLTVVVASIGGLSYWLQSERIAASMLAKAQEAKEAGDVKEHAKWLKRYVGLVPNNTEAMYDFAISLDEQVVDGQSLLQARKYLSSAIGSLGNSIEDDKKRKELRRRLIQRLILLGGVWASEAERQIILLDPEPNDPDAMLWLAKSLEAQRRSMGFQVRNPKRYNKREDFWLWQASQTTGDVLLAAHEANKNDAMVGRLLTGICLQNPEWFDSPEGKADRKRLEKIARETAITLADYAENAEAQFSAISYFLRYDKEKADGLIERAVPKALDRIEGLVKGLTPISDERDESGDVLLPAATGPIAQVELYWNWQLVLTAAYQEIGSKNFASAESLLKQLVQYDADQLARELRENTYLLLSEAQREQKKTDEAVATLESGLEAINESRPLLRTLAYVYLDSEDKLAKAKETIELYSTTIENQLVRLDGVEGSNFTTNQRQQIRTELRFAEWNSQVLHGRMLALEKSLPEAASVLQRCFDSKLAIENPQLVPVGQALASVYMAQQLFDLAGETLDKCVSLAPENEQLRKLSVQCWIEAGLLTRAAQVDQALDDGSFEFAIRAASLAASLEASKPIGDSNIFIVKQKIAEAKKRLEASDDPEVQKQTWRVAMFEALLPTYERQMGRRERSRAASPPTEQEEAEALDERAKMLASMKELGELYPNSVELQSRLVSIFSQEQDFDSANQALKRIEDFSAADEQTPESVVSIRVLAKARLLAAQQDIDGALDVIRTGMTEDPDYAYKLAQSGANLAIQAKRGRDAFNLLNAVRDIVDRPSVSLLVQVASLATALAADPASPKVEFDFRGCIAELKQIEGEDGTHWRYVQGERLLAQADLAVAEKKNPGKILEQAADELKEILLRRPRWGMAAALGGDIARRQGFSGEAVRFYNRAIRNGDQSIRTRLKLAEVFLTTGKTKEAEQLIQQMAGVSEDVVALDSLSANLAEKQGNYIEALRFAELSAAKRKSDPGPLLLIARLNSLMASQTLDQALESKYREAANVALSQAEELADTSGSSRQWMLVKTRRIEDHFSNSNRDAILAEIDSITGTNKAPLNDRLLLVGRTYYSLGEYGETQKIVDQLLQMDRRNTEAYLLLYQLNLRLGDSERAIDALRSANRAAPENMAIAERLALTLAINSEDQAPWDEIDRLLTRDEASSTTQTKLLRAQIALIKGDEARQKSAARELSKLSERTDTAGLNAKRLLARHYASLWQKTAMDVTSPETMERFDRSASIQQEILRSPDASPDDFAKYAQLLLAAGFAEFENEREPEAREQLDKATRAISALEEQTGSSIASLRLAIRLDQLRSALNGTLDQAGDKAADAAKKWIENIGQLESFGEQKVWAIAGRTLVDMGFASQALVWLERIYEADPSQYKLLVIGLTQAKQYDRALELCTENYSKDPDPGIAALISEIALLDHSRPLPKAAQEILDNALDLHSNNPLLFESLGTLELMRKNYDRAIELYEAAINLLEGKDSIRVLNNLAIALSRSETRKPEALTKINQAIDNFGRTPDLIDTKGSVHQALGQFDEAEEAFEEATLLSSNPTFRIHLIDVQLDAGDLSNARKNWNKIPHDRLKRMSITEDDIELYKQLKKKLDSDSDEMKGTDK